MTSNTTPVDTSILDKMEYEVLIQAINGISDVRSYDEYTLWVATAGVIASILVACAAFWLNHRQISIAREQKSISDMQAKIMEQQNRIALLEKRLEAFNILGLFVSNVQRFYKKTCQRKDEGGTSSIQYYLQGILLASTKNPHKYKNLTKTDFQKNSVNDLNELKQAILLTQLIFELDSQEQAELSELDMILDLSYKLTGKIDISKNGNDALSYDKIIEILSHYSSINERSLLIDSLYAKMEVVHS